MTNMKLLKPVIKPSYLMKNNNYKQNWILKKKPYDSWTYRFNLEIILGSILSLHNFNFWQYILTYFKNHREAWIGKKKIAVI